MIIISAIFEGVHVKGYEIDHAKIQKFKGIIHIFFGRLADVGLYPMGLEAPQIQAADLAGLTPTMLDGAKVIFAFWESIPENAKKACGPVFMSSTTLEVRTYMFKKGRLSEWLSNTCSFIVETYENVCDPIFPYMLNMHFNFISPTPHRLSW